MELGACLSYPQLLTLGPGHGLAMAPEHLADQLDVGLFDDSPDSPQLLLGEVGTVGLHQDTQAKLPSGISIGESEEWHLPDLNANIETTLPQPLTHGLENHEEGKQLLHRHRVGEISQKGHSHLLLVATILPRRHVDVVEEPPPPQSHEPVSAPEMQELAK